VIKAGIREQGTGLAELAELAGLVGLKSREIWAYGILMEA
jgi:lambda repressor-like predicted transcriptional regulator